LINAAYIMILAAVWKLQQGRSGYIRSMTHGQPRELASIDASIQILEFCGQRNPMARRYLLQIKDLRRQILIQSQTNEASPSSAPLSSNAVSSSASLTDSDPVADNLAFRNLRVSNGQTSFSPSILSRSLSANESHSSASPSMNLEGWPSAQYGMPSGGTEESIYGEFELF
jgi:hypothetical protein